MIGRMRAEATEIKLTLSWKVETSIGYQPGTGDMIVAKNKIILLAPTRNG